MAFTQQVKLIPSDRFGEKLSPLEPSGVLPAGERACIVRLDVLPLQYTLNSSIPCRSVVELHVSLDNVKYIVHNDLKAIGTLVRQSRDALADREGVADVTVFTYRRGVVKTRTIEADGFEKTFPNAFGILSFPTQKRKAAESIDKNEEEEKDEEEYEPDDDEEEDDEDYEPDDDEEEDDEEYEEETERNGEEKQEDMIRKKRARTG